MSTSIQHVVLSYVRISPVDGVWLYTWMASYDYRMDGSLVWKKYSQYCKYTRHERMIGRMMDGGRMVCDGGGRIDRLRTFNAVHQV